MAFPGHEFGSGCHAMRTGQMIRSAQEYISIFFQCDGQSLKPVHPLLTQMTFNLDLKDLGLIWVTPKFCSFGIIAP